MTLYVSRHARHVIEIWSGNQELMNVNGSPKMVTRMPQLAAEFQPGGLTNPQRLAAAQVFGMVKYGRELIMLPNSIDMGDDEDGTLLGRVGWRPGYSTEAAATANPRDHDDIVLDARGQSVATSAYDPQFNLGRYNTGKDWNDPECMIPFGNVKARTEKEKQAVWEACEEALKASDDFGLSVVAIDASTLPPPFPGFAKIKGESAQALEQMKTVCDLAQFNYGVLLEYEEATLVRPKMIALFREGYERQLAAAKTQADVMAGLEVTL